MADHWVVMVAKLAGYLAAPLVDSMALSLVECSVDMKALLKAARMVVKAVMLAVHSAAQMADC